MSQTLLCSFTQSEGAGGVAVVSRLLKRSLENQGSRQLKNLVFDQKTSWLPASPRQLRYGAFTVMCRAAMNSASHVIYDSPNMARIHSAFGPAKRPYAVFIHGIEVWEHAQPAWIDAIRSADLIIANSHYTLEKAQRIHGPLGKVQKVCHLATLPSTIRELPEIESVSVPNVLIVGRMDDGEGYKGHRELITAWPEVVKQVPEAELHIVGKGSGMPALQELATTSTAKDRIHFHGHVPLEKLESLYAGCSLFAMPSRGEGFGLVYLEAMQQGKAVIVSKQDAGHEVIEDGVTGLAVDLDDEGALLDSLLSLLGNPEQCREMGAAGFQRWLNHFTYDAFQDRLQEAVHEFLMD